MIEPRRYKPGCSHAFIQQPLNLKSTIAFAALIDILMVVAKDRFLNDIS